MEQFKVVGMGPGGRQYITPAAMQAVMEAGIIAGAPRQLAEVDKEIQDNKKQTFVYQSNLKELLEFLKTHRERKIAVLVAGDPGFHSLLGAISRDFSPHEYQVIPGVSCFQLAMARIGKPWQADSLFSCHGKDFDHIEQAVLDCMETGRRLILLTDKKRSPQRIAVRLMEKGQCDARVWLAQNLGLSNENMVETSLEALAEMGSGASKKSEQDMLCVMIIQKPAPFTG